MKKNILFLLFIIMFYSFETRSNVSVSEYYEVMESNISNTANISSNQDYFVEGSLGQNIASSVVSKSIDYSLRLGFYNPPHFQFQRKLPLHTWWDNRIGINYPSNSVDLDRFDVIFISNIQDNDINEATKKLSKIKGINMEPVESFSFSFFDEEELKPQMINKGKILVKVNDLNSDGYVDSIVEKIRLKTLSGYVYDKEYKMWAKAFSSNISFYNNYVIVEFETLSNGIFSVMGDVDESVKDVYAYPVPFRPNGSKSGVCSGCSGSEDEGITFYNLPQRGYIEIYTVDGRVVRKINIDETTLINESGGIGKIKWNTKNEAGEKVASGTYIWRVVSESYLQGYKNSKTGKLIIIR